MRRLVVGLLPLLSSCLLWVEFEDKLDGGAGGTGGAVSGGAPAGGSAAGGAPAGGAPAGGGPAGGAPAGGGDPCGEGTDADPENCGAPDVRCGGLLACCGGVCESVATRTPYDSVEITVTPPADAQPADPLTLGVAGPSMSLLLWSPSFSASSSPLLIGPGTMNTSGYLTSARPNGSASVLMRRQSCPGPQPCLEVWAPNSAAQPPVNTCGAFWSWDLPGDHINGAVWVDSSIYFLTTGANIAAPDPMTYELYVVDAVVPGSCEVTPVLGRMPVVAAQFISPTTPSLLDVDPLTGELWWTTYGEGGCVFRWQPGKPPMGPPEMLECAVTPASDFDLGFAKWTQAGLVLSSSDPAQPLRLVERSQLCTGCAPVALSSADTITVDQGGMIFPPFDTDRSFVFGVDAAGTQVMAVALSPESSVGALRGAVAIEPGDIWRAVEGSEGEQLFFSTSRPSEMDPSLKHALHRWRKPACSAQIPICSDGCINGREQCDDGNESNADWCLQNCALATCGDGFLRIGVEECDDGNTANDDGCSTTCENEP